MTLQSSGAISISQMRDEYQLGNPISMNNFYGKNGLPGSGVIRFSDFYGKSNRLDLQVVTAGSWTTVDGFTTLRRYGFADEGSISDGTCNFKGGVAINQLVWADEINNSNFLFRLATAQTNDGWSHLVVNGRTFYRSNAVMDDGNRRWKWPLAKGDNPFGTTTRGLVWNIEFF